MAMSILVGVKDEKNIKGEWVWKGLSLIESAGKKARRDDAGGGGVRPHQILNGRFKINCSDIHL